MKYGKQLNKISFKDSKSNSNFWKSKFKSVLRGHQICFARISFVVAGLGFYSFYTTQHRAR